jgi:hypothetical protein
MIILHLAKPPIARESLEDSYSLQTISLKRTDAGGDIRLSPGSRLVLIVGLILVSER